MIMPYSTKVLYRDSTFGPLTLFPDAVRNVPYFQVICFREYLVRGRRPGGNLTRKFWTGSPSCPVSGPQASQAGGARLGLTALCRHCIAVWCASNA